MRLIFLTILLFSLAGCSRGAIRHADGPHPGPVVILGDSLGAGYGVEEGEGFVELLSSRLGLAIVNLSVSGITTSKSLPLIKEEVLSLEPSLVILELGGNDALQKVNTEQTRAHLATMIEQLYAEEIPVLLLGVRGGILTDTFEGLFEGLVEEYETGYVSNILDGILTRADLKLDHIHPNAQGHLKIADRVEPELRRVLRQRGKGV